MRFRAVPGSAAGQDDPRLEESLGKWVRALLDEHPVEGPGVEPPEILIVGRCDDIRPTTDVRNRKLARDRANGAADIVRATAGSHPWLQAHPEILRVFGEQDAGFRVDNEEMRGALVDIDRVIIRAVPEGRVLGAEARLDSFLLVSEQTGRLMPELYDFDEYDNKLRAPRPRYRRVDVLVRSIRAPDATEPAASTPENELGQDPGLGRRLVWVPGPDAPETTEPQLADPSYPVLVQAALAWDSPTVTEARDLVPTKAEVSVAWVHRAIRIPEVADPVPVTSCKDDPATVEIFKFTARFAHDDRTGETVYTIGLDSSGDPRGLYCIRNDPLAATAALAPAILPLLAEAGVDEDGARVAALVAIAAAGFAAAEDGRLVIEGVEAELRSRGFLQIEDLRLRLGVDYAVDIGWDLAPLLTGSKVRIRYRNVGVQVDLSVLDDLSALDLDTVRLIYDEASVEVQNPGTWKIANPTLGRLLRVNAARLGTGSAWIEVDLGLAVDLGIITITEATVRATLGDGGFDVDLRGLEVLLDVPGVVRGRGKLAVAPDGALSSAIELQVIPAGISAAASLKIVDGFVSLFVETRFATPLPIGGTGLGVFGFNGHLVVNGERALPAASDPVTRELAWYARAPEDRYQPRPGGWAVGLGAVVGTLPDEGFVFNAKGMLAIAVPELAVTLGVEAEFLKKPGPATASGAPPPDAGDETLRVVGLIAVDRNAVTLGLDGAYSYRNLLSIKVPVRGLFPTGGEDPFFLRVGSDGYVGDPPGTGARPGAPVTATILPETLNVDATAFFMVEEKGLPALGKHADINLPGFAIGTGLTFEIDWGNDLIGLDAKAEVVAGVGFTPLTVAAGVFVDGEIFFLLLSAGIEGELFFRYVERPGEDIVQVRGRLCARVGVWKWKKTKCGTIAIGEETFAPPVPSPVAGVDLIGQSDRVIGQAAAASGDPAPVVWPDAIPVIHFAHAVRVALSAGAFDPGAAGGPTWVGSQDLRHAYRLTRVEIRPVGGAALAGPLPSAWTFPAHRGSFPAEGDPPSGDERRDLHLLSDMAFRWARNLIDGGAGIAADPAASLDRVCEPVPQPQPVCALGQDARRRGPERAVVTPAAPGPGPFPSFFRVVIRERLGPRSLPRTAIELAEQGLELRFGRVVPFAGPPGITGLYEAARVLEHGRHVVSLPMECRIAPNVVAPELLLAVCTRGPVAGQPGQRCDDWEDVRDDFVFQTLTHGGLDYQVIHGPATGFLRVTDAGGQRAVRYPDQGLDIDLPEFALAVEATIYQARRTGDDVQPPVSLTLEIFDGGGQRLGRSTDRRDRLDQNRTLRLEDRSGRGIFRARLSGGDGRSHLVRLCYTARLDPRLDDPLAEAGEGAPRVRGRRKDGVEVEWTAEVVTQPIGTAPPPCTLVRYVPRQDAEWTDIRVGPSRAGPVGLVRLCAVTAEAQRRRDEAEEDRQDFIDDWNTPPTPPRTLLQPDTEYEVEVRWESDTWVRPELDGAPSPDETEPPDAPDYGDEQVDTFRFRTAAEPAALPPEPPIDDLDEGAFDPRQAGRYVLRIAPDHTAPPHFTDDPLRVSYAVRYLRDLLGRYDRELRVELRRTDPPPASRPQGTPPPAGAEPLATTSEPIAFELLALVDVRVLVATADSDCLTEWTPEGTTDALDFDLAPNASYDLLVTAPKPSAPEPFDVILRRAHFRTSAHASPRALLDAFGFLGDLPGASLPIEMPVAAPLPADAVEGDAAFDAAMAALGLDPLPLPAAARVALLVTTGPAPMLAGVLVDGPEPLLRARRLSFARAALTLADGATLPLGLVRQTEAGTRLLLALPAPVDPGADGATMELVLRGTREGEVAGRRFVTAGGLASATGGLA